MTCDYEAIRRDNETRFGTDIGRIGPMLLSDRYDDRTHFIYELLQNAEDALARRGSWRGSRSVSFRLSVDALLFRHFGIPFDENDVRGICGIAESTKGSAAIGRFGIGFKSVYAFTDRPEVHSGSEAFAIESYVWPLATERVDRDPNETVIRIPLRPGDDAALGEIARGLQTLDPSTLLFLRHIEEIRWEVESGGEGLCLRQAEEIDEHARRVTLLGQEEGKPDSDEEWLVFSRPVFGTEGSAVGNVELGFRLGAKEGEKRRFIQRVSESPLVVYFPTIVDTHLGFLIQGPYRTTPSRDNVVKDDSWNESLVRGTASLLDEVLPWLRDNDLLDAAALHCLPLRTGLAVPGLSMLRPLYDATTAALLEESLLPRSGGGHVSAARGRLAATHNLRALFASEQLGQLFGKEHELSWLSEEISHGQTSVLRAYVMRQLGVPELTIEKLIPRLSKEFLEQQSDDWIKDLYEFLGGQPSLREKLGGSPLVRLENGNHIVAVVDSQPQAFLPTNVRTDFPTVRRSVCSSEESLKFLRSLGLTGPNAVDDVVRNVLPRFAIAGPEANVDYADSIDRIVKAMETDSKTQRDKLLSALRETVFVMSVDGGNGQRTMSKPGEVYQATGPLKGLFSSVSRVLLVDDAQEALRGEAISELLEAAGATAFLKPVNTDCQLTSDEKREIRRSAGLKKATEGSEVLNDNTLQGLDELIGALATMEPDEQRVRARLLWDALRELADRRGVAGFNGEYTWSYSHQAETAPFDAAFVRKLNGTEWVPDERGRLTSPNMVVFETLGWEPNPILESKIRFKPPIIEQLAKEAGIEPGLLDLLRRIGVTSESELRERLGIGSEQENELAEDATMEVGPHVQSSEGPAKTEGRGTESSASKASGLSDREPSSSRSPRRAGTPGGGTQAREVASRTTAPSSSTPVSERQAAKKTTATREFISYVGVHPEQATPDPDGLTHAARMTLEAEAIAFILAREEEWQTTDPNNPGYDLYIPNEDGEIVRLCEVKAMKGCLEDHPVGLSRTQFEWAQEYGDSYWLYVVERAGTDAAKLVRIQDPAGKARTFTFDRGWREIAEHA